VPTTRIPGFLLTYQVVEVPLDHAAPDDDRTIEVFAREVDAPGSTIHTDGVRGLRRLADTRARRESLDGRSASVGSGTADPQATRTWPVRSRRCREPRVSGLGRPRANQPLPTLKLGVLYLHRILQLGV